MKQKVKLAKKLSKTFHKGQTYGLYDYFEYHITGVVNLLKVHNMPAKFIIVAYLHDIVEDTKIDISTVKNLFGKEIADAVDAMTKRKNESRKEYITRCAANKIARFVKLQDAVFNASNCFKNKNSNQFNYYMDTIALLKSN